MSSVAAAAADENSCCASRGEPASAAAAASVSSKIDNKEGHGIDKLTDDDKNDGHIDKDGSHQKDGHGIDKFDGLDKQDGEGFVKSLTRDFKKDSSNHVNPTDKCSDIVPSLPKKPRTDLNKYGLPFTLHEHDVIVAPSTSQNTIERSLRKDGELKDFARSRPASRLDRLRATLPPSEPRASERERSRSGDR